jgi:endonuclease YncB( thermonuclease family)
VTNRAARPPRAPIICHGYAFRGKSRLPGDLKVRRPGVSPPTENQKAQGHRSQRQPRALRREAAQCGAKAANDLDAFIASRPVNCLPISLDRYGRTVAMCLVGGADLGDWLVRDGLALDWPNI